LKSDVEFVDFKTHFDVIFEYNPKIVRVMRLFRGQYLPGPPKRWRFPIIRKPYLASELRLSGFTVDDSHFTLEDCVKK
jgi:hypothetical protein